MTGQVQMVAERADSDAWNVEITTPSGNVVRRVVPLIADEDGVEWPMPTPRPDDADAASAWDLSLVKFRALTKAVTDRQAEADGAKGYGRHLFDCFIGAEAWAKVQQEHQARSPLVVNLVWRDSSLHRFVWDLLYNDAGFLNLAGASPAVFLRICEPEENAVPRKPVTMEGSPRVLFAVGASLGDARVRAGAEVMSIFRSIDRAKRNTPSVIRARVLTQASREALESECSARQPDVVHLIGHGALNRATGRGEVSLAGDGGGPDVRVDGARLAEAVGDVKLVILSVCEGGRADTAEADLPRGRPNVEVELPLAAELVSRGVPIVVAMAGEVSDTACRAFTRSFVSSIAQGVPLIEAITIGRRSVYYLDLQDPGLVDWALPSVFLSSTIEEDFRLADVDSTQELADAIDRYDFSSQPLFAGRHELLADLERLLTQTGTASSMILHARTTKLGGTRALIELAAEALRMGSLPIYVGEFTAEDAPKSLALLAWEIAKKMRVIAFRERVEQPVETMRMLAVMCLGDVEAAKRTEPELFARLNVELNCDHGVGDPTSLAEAITNDTYTLRDRLVVAKPTLMSDSALPLLLLDDVHRYGHEGFKAFLSWLGPMGASPTDRPLPVVLFGKEYAGDSAPLLMQFGNDGKFTKKNHRRIELTSIKNIAREDSRIAVLTWLLNPAVPDNDKERANFQIAVPLDLTTADPAWLGNALNIFHNVFFDRGGFDGYIEEGIRQNLLVWGNDDRALEAYEKANS